MARPRGSPTQASMDGWQWQAHAGKGIKSSWMGQAGMVVN